MPVYQLLPDLIFPPPDLSEPDGLLAVGGDLRIERLLLAYSMGIFPWYDQDTPILWWSPDPRLVLDPAGVHVSRSLARTLRQGRFQVTVDRAFDRVVRGCSLQPRPDQEGTWILPEVIDAYGRLHRAGFAHSIEVWQDQQLVGGLYGVSLGRAFFGESMFSRVSNASKVALVYLGALLSAWQFNVIDCQMTTPHLERMGAYEIPRAQFLERLQAALAQRTIRGPWRLPSVLTIAGVHLVCPDDLPDHAGQA